MSQIDYDALVQTALRQAVKGILEMVKKKGLTGSHHFYITFRTDHPEAVLPQYLIERHPEEITIVLQYQFWNLTVSPVGFDVTLSFNDVHEGLHVPFDAMTSFVDPSVKFGLQFVPIMTPGRGKKFSPVGVQQDKVSSQDDITTSEKEETAESNVIMLDAFRKK